MVIGVISDTHGLLRPEAVHALQGVDHILHGGDVGKSHILQTLRQIAPLTAIRGNIDKGDEWRAMLPATAAVELDGRWIYLLHDLHDLDIDPEAAGMELIISGHSHKPAIRRDGPVTYLNPGSAGPRRFSLPITLARIDTAKPDWGIELIPLLP